MEKKKTSQRNLRRFSVVRRESEKVTFRFVDRNASFYFFGTFRFADYISKIEVYPQYLDEYIKYAVKVGEVSLRTEPGVLTMYAVQDQETPSLVTILETYSSKDAYEKHIASTHFQKYKKGMLHMVKSLQLCDQTALNPANKINNYIDQ